MISAETNGHAGDELGEGEVQTRLKREVIYEAVAALESSGMRRADAFVQVAKDRGTTPSNVSGAYYAERRVRRLALTEDLDPAEAIIAALSEIEEAVAKAKVVIASATMQYEQLREDAARYAELRKAFR